tara:strand:+ start:8797 stop:9780 length:984 start_codon:yes stop_codon:yes gene_type:complete
MKKVKGIAPAISAKLNMIDVNILKHPELYFDYRKGLELLKTIKEDDYAYPEEKTIFHVYTEARTPKELLSIKSYVATQNLQKTQLIVWSDYDISKQENVQPYKNIVDFRVYDVKELAKGTPLEGVKSHLKTEGDHNHWMSSGIMRFLVLYKFGGIYYDMDMVLLRDFKPILGQDFAYQWGGDTDFAKERRLEGDICHGPCAALLGAQKGGDYIEACMQQLVKTPPTGGTCYDEDMMSYVYRTTPFTVFPSSFFNTEWLISKVDIPLSEDVEKRWFDTPLQDLNHLFLEAFAWHWHNSSNKQKTVVEGSKFDLLEKLTDKKLKELKIL